MSSALSKRQQARNERALQELIKSVAGNDRCADCQARNPGWASWSLGIFLCMRCATLHRKLGTHVSKVKSLSMDSWTTDQVDNMKKTGNVVANKIYNPRNVKPPIPIDVDEVDSAMERFIRQKYELKTLEDGKPKPPSREDPSYTIKPIDNSSPPPLPPKPSRRFGFGLRSISSSHGSSGSDKSSHRQESLTVPMPLPNNKQSKTFGVSLGDANGSMESKLTMLQDMGFPDDKRNSTVLRGLNGDLERAVDTLTRLGENVNRSHSPAPGTVQNGAKVVSDSSNNLTPPSTSTSSNPFDKLDSTSLRGSAGISVNQSQPQSAGGSVAENRPELRKQASYNPFDMTAAPQSASSTLDQSLQNLQISQPLFPNSTGGYPSQQAQMQFSGYQQSATPPVTMSAAHGLVPSPAPSNGNYNPFFQQTTPTSNRSNNISPAPSQNLSPSNPFFGQGSMQTPSSQMGASYSQPQSAPIAGPPFTLQHANTMPSFPSTSVPPQPQSLYPQQSGSNPFTTQPASSIPQYQTQFNQQPQLGSQTLPQNNRMDKSSILALYSFSQPPPTIQEQPQQLQPQQPQFQQPQFQQPQFQQPQFQQPQNQQIQIQNQNQPNQNQNQNQNQQPQQNQFGAAPAQLPQLQTQSAAGYPFQMQPSGTMPMSAPAGTSSSGNHNPFFNSTNTPANQTSPLTNNGLNGTKPPARNTPFIRSHMSQESMDIGRTPNGRHSPDVFASLSARYVQ